MSNMNKKPMTPAGWQLVPVEPTPKMIDEGQYSRLCPLTGSESSADIYRAMLAAAPTAGQAAAKDAQDTSLPSSRPDLERVLREWNEATGALPRDSGWFYEVLGMMQDAWDTSSAMAAAPEVK